MIDVIDRNLIRSENSDRNIGICINPRFGVGMEKCRVPSGPVIRE